MVTGPLLAGCKRIDNENLTLVVISCEIYEFAIGIHKGIEKVLWSLTGFLLLLLLQSVVTGPLLASCKNIGIEKLTLAAISHEICETHQRLVT